MLCSRLTFITLLVFYLVGSNGYIFTSYPLNEKKRFYPLSIGISTNSAVIQVENQFILDFLLEAKDTVGSYDWDVKLIRKTKDNFSFKCTAVGTKGKSLFVKHSREHLASNSRLRYEYEGNRLDGFVT